MKLRRFNEEGLTRFRAFLRDVPTLALPNDLLTDASTSDAIEGAANSSTDIEQRPFASRLDAAAYLDRVIAAAGLADPDRDAGLWSWLALFYFDQLAPPSKSSGRKAGEETRYVLAIDNGRRYYRHMLLGPWSIYRLYRDTPDQLLGLLSSPLHIATSETYRLFIENPTLIACQAAVAAATELYFDRDKGKLKRGAGSKDAGGCRRLIAFLQQLDCTFDLPLLSPQQLIKLLPAEFRRFVPRQFLLPS